MRRSSFPFSPTAFLPLSPSICWSAVAGSGRPDARRRTTRANSEHGSTVECAKIRLPENVCVPSFARTGQHTRDMTVACALLARGRLALSLVQSIPLASMGGLVSAGAQFLRPNVGSRSHTRVQLLCSRGHSCTAPFQSTRIRRCGACSMPYRVATRAPWSGGGGAYP